MNGENIETPFCIHSKSFIFFLFSFFPANLAETVLLYNKMGSFRMRANQYEVIYIIKRACRFGIRKMFSSFDATWHFAIIIIKLNGKNGNCSTENVVIRQYTFENFPKVIINSSLETCRFSITDTIELFPSSCLNNKLLQLCIQRLRRKINGKCDILFLSPFTLVDWMCDLYLARQSNNIIVWLKNVLALTIKLYYLSNVFNGVEFESLLN